MITTCPCPGKLLSPHGQRNPAMRTLIAESINPILRPKKHDLFPKHLDRSDLFPHPARNGHGIPVIPKSKPRRIISRPRTYHAVSFPNRVGRLASDRNRRVFQLYPRRLCDSAKQAFPYFKCQPLNNPAHMCRWHNRRGILLAVPCLQWRQPAAKH